MLGGPVCADPSLVRFLKNLIIELKSPAFVQINQRLAKVLHEQFDYKITPLGVETYLPVQEYSLENDPKKRNLRSFIRKGQVQANVYELNQHELYTRFGINSDHLDEISKAWMATKVVQKPLRFLVRNVIYEDEPYVRKFYSFDGGGNVLGFVFFNPIFREGSVIGHCADIMRTSPDASKGHVAYIVMAALSKFRSEGKEVLSLGLSPCAGLTKTGFKHDQLTYHLLKFMYAYGNRLYSFVGIHGYKKQYNASERQVFAATHRFFSGLELFAIMRFIGVI